MGVRALLCVAGLAATVAVAPGCGGSPVPAATDVDLAHGKQLFQQRCGGCHTLADAGTKGTLGPDLDQAYLGPRLQGFKPSSFEAMVHQQIAQAEQPMPRNLVTGQDAVDVAAYIASVAGVKLAQQGGGGAAG